MASLFLPSNSSDQQIILKSVEISGLSRIISILYLFIKLIAALLAIAIVWPLSEPISNFFATSFGSPELGLALFVMFYSVIFFPLFIPLNKPLIKLSEKLIRDKEEENKKKLLLYIDERLLSNPNIALMEAKNEIMHMHNLAMLNFRYGYEYLVKKDKTNVHNAIKYLFI